MKLQDETVLEEVLMKTLLHLKRHEDHYFHVHPLHGMFSLMVSSLLAALLVLMLVLSAR